MLSLNNITLSRGNKILLENSSATIYERQKVGVVGQNGCGKSSLFAMILGQLIPDRGEYSAKSQLEISHLSQQLPDCDHKALDFVLSGDESYMELQKRLALAEKEHHDAEVLLCHELLNQSSGYSKPAKAASIMSGLGFKTEEQKKSVNSFSGGWRMRLSLARCLMKPADLLLLDEPTNHLDMEAIFWLERWLKQCPSTILLISHDREFLDALVTHILHIEQQGIHLYSGNYSRFEQTRAQQLALQQKMHEKQQQKINHLMAYVNRFRAKASKAKQAQSRLNAIAKMELIAQAQLDSPFSFNFYPCLRTSNPLIHLNQVTAGYDSKPILKRINLSINPGERIALLGPNGQGKSTLVKTLTGTLPPLAGSMHQALHLKVGYYAQHQLEELNDQLSPLQTIQLLSPEIKEQAIRDFLGGFNFLADMAVVPIRHFSGGEKARLALAKLVWQKPNLLLLDEPTNHLDLNMRAAIEIALQSYEGAMVLISHDRHLLRTTVDDFYLVYDGELAAFKGDLDDYYQWLQNREQKKANPKTDSHSHREKKSLQNRLKKLEQMINQFHDSLRELENKLTDLSLYEDGQQNKLQSLTHQQTKMKQELAATEEEWLAVVAELEQI
jgi:ATP-binding cassette subfamily F protein 3